MCRTGGGALLTPNLTHGIPFKPKDLYCLRLSFGPNLGPFRIVYAVPVVA
jgi:hypothetical protein